MDAGKSGGNGIAAIQVSAKGHMLSAKLKEMVHVHIDRFKFRLAIIS